MTEYHQLRIQRALRNAQTAFGVLAGALTSHLLMRLWEVVMS